MKNKGKVVEFNSATPAELPESMPEGCVKADVVETNARGGKQSKTKGRMTEVPPLALIEVSAVMGLGATNYPRDEQDRPNWYNISCLENLDHAMEHVANFMAERNTVEGKHASLEFLFERNLKLNEELSHATARMMMAMELFIIEGVK